MINKERQKKILELKENISLADREIEYWNEEIRSSGCDIEQRQGIETHLKSDINIRQDWLDELAQLEMKPVEVVAEVVENGALHEWLKKRL